MHTVTCHTEGCENQGIPMSMMLEFTDEDTGETIVTTDVRCGPCGQPITDIDPPLE